MAFNLPHVRIIGTHHCSKSRRELFKLRRDLRDVLCLRNYAERVVSSFSHQIK